MDMGIPEEKEGGEVAGNEGDLAGGWGAGLPGKGMEDLACGLD